MVIISRCSIYTQNRKCCSNYMDKEENEDDAISLTKSIPCHVASIPAPGKQREPDISPTYIKSWPGIDQILKKILALDPY